MSLYTNPYLLEEKIKDIINSKSEAWSYESEYRAIALPEDCRKKLINNEKLCFVNFNPKSLVRIDLGLYCNQELTDAVIEELKREELNHIHLFRAIIHHDEYRLDYQPLN